MGLLGNGFRHNSVGRITTATTGLDGANASTLPASYNLTAMRRNLLLGAGITNKLASVPSGKRHPNVWMMAKEGGSISSFRRTNIAISGSAVGELGFPRSGSTSITITGTAAGGLIVGATGTATISIDGTAAIVATLNATGSTTISIDGTAIIGAIASITGNATMTIDGNSSVMALGYMTGTTIETGELTPESIALKVWEFLINGTEAQDLLAAAGAAGDPLLGVVEDGKTMREVLRIMAAALAGTSTKVGNTITFKGLDGTTDRIVGSFDAENNRTGAVLDGS